MTIVSVAANVALTSSNVYTGVIVCAKVLRDISSEHFEWLQSRHSQIMSHLCTRIRITYPYPISFNKFPAPRPAYIFAFRIRTWRRGAAWSCVGKENWSFWLGRWQIDWNVGANDNSIIGHDDCLIVDDIRRHLRRTLIITTVRA